MALTEMDQTDLRARATPSMPKSKGECQKVLRRFGYKGLKIDEIGDPAMTKDGAVEARVYALTGPILQADGEMRRFAKTIIFRFTDDEVSAHDVEGWIV